MRFSVFLFISIQVIVWSIVFSRQVDTDASAEIEILSDTWHVINLNYIDENGPLHDYDYQQLTLNLDGSFSSTYRNGDKRLGEWRIDKIQNLLTLESTLESDTFEIVKFPKDDFNYFIIRTYKSTFDKGPEYKLTRL